ncbi:hypothetical protein ACIQHY_12560 [Streptomyces sp. NPDC092359]|uniref:hypothetical protein n=1 Tax=Streptomyces sp. NPDC092359 TaxID=3366014 RepID=UPI00380D6EF4
MRDEWEYAHTDYARPPQRPAPASLAESEGDWRGYLENGTPNGWLIRHGAMTAALASGQPLYLLHTTKNIAAIHASGELHVSTGCLVGALYCSPLARQREGWRPHNLGAYLMATKPDTTPIIFEVIPDAPVPTKGVDYLHLGPVHLRTYLRFQSFLTRAENDQISHVVLTGLSTAAGFLDIALRNATGGPSTAAPEFIDQLAAAVPSIPFLGYLYFEVLSEYLMLHSESPETKAYAQAGELNNWLYKRAAFAAVDGMHKLFDLARFQPRHQQLVQLVGSMEPGLAAGVADYVRRRLSHLLARTALHPSQDAAAVTFQGADLGTLGAIAPGLIGQMVFRQVRYMPRYRQQLYHCFEKAKALEAWDYWNSEGIPTPFNGLLPKGEIGIQPVYPQSAIRAWTAERDSKGLLHPGQEVTAAFTTHLASWWAPPRHPERRRTDPQAAVNRPSPPLPANRPSMEGITA